ncbi:MAG: glycoside hydrolase family 5 protein [Actinomycetota bacterium]|nr:glycoside hydrolase family 5 protein [Actinomycetota bacterium]
MTHVVANRSDAVRRALVALAALAALGLASAPAAGAARANPVPQMAFAHHALTTAVTSSGPFFGDDAGLAFQRARDAGARAIRIYTSWRFFAPGGSSRPSGFDPTNPADPRYNFTGLDNIVKRAVSYGLAPILSLQDAPDWAEGAGSGLQGTVAPDPAALADFATAVARRYSGHFGGLPRVRWYGVWNEPNANFFLTPQFDSAGNVVSVDRYRRMVNGVADAVKAVDGSNLVMAGTLFAVDKPGTAVGALRFTRLLLCVSAQVRPRATCPDATRFDSYGIDPYTSGYAFHRADDGKSAELGDLGALRSVVDGAFRLGHVRSRARPAFWVTEFSWDTNPPDPGGVPAQTLVRWTAEALFQSWRSGVSLFTWFQMEDDQLGGDTVFQGGLYFRCDGGFRCAQPKPGLAAYRFPFVAYRQPGGRLFFWGRTPAGVPRRVIVEQARGATWRRLALLRTDRYGVFWRTVRSSSSGLVRARVVGGEQSPAFSPSRSRERPGTTPFGSS